MTRLRFLPATGMLLATSLLVVACGAATGGHPAAAPSTGQVSAATDAAVTPTAPAGTGATAPAGSPSMTAVASPGQPASAAPPASPSAESAGFGRALAAWESAAAAPAATLNAYLQQSADDLQTSGNSSYGTAISELTYLAHLPATNDTPAQQAQARADVQALDAFFGTPGLMS